MTVPLGRLVQLVSEVPNADGLRLGLESIESGTGKRLPNDHLEYAGAGIRFECGDVLFGKLRPYLAKAWLADMAGTAIGEFYVLRPDPDRLNSRYLLYFILSEAFLSPVRSSVFGAKMPRASWDTMRNVALLVPPLPEQQAIADYLDRETARIDTLITKQESLITLLRERRESLIVRSALGPFNPFDMSRLGTSIGSAFSVTLGKMLDAAGQSTSEGTLAPYVRATNIQDFGLSLNDINTMKFTELEMGRYELRRGDLLAVEGGASVGTTVVLAADKPGWAFQKTVNRVRSLGASSTEWLAYVLRAYRDMGVIDIVCNKSTIPHLTAEKLRALRIPVLSPAEQREIVACLDEQTAKIDALIAKAQRFIELAKERRAALITAAVTGQIDVRDAA